MGTGTKIGGGPDYWSTTEFRRRHTLLFESDGDVPNWAAQIVDWMLFNPELGNEICDRFLHRYDPVVPTREPGDPTAAPLGGFEAPSWSFSKIAKYLEATSGRAPEIYERLITGAAAPPEEESEHDAMYRFFKGKG